MSTKARRCFELVFVFHAWLLIGGAAYDILLRDDPARGCILLFMALGYLIVSWAVSPPARRKWPP